MLLYTYNDGSKLKMMSARSLTQIPVWQGNRIIDHVHVEAIKREVGNNIKQLDSNFCIVRYDVINTEGCPTTAEYIIDGQHRQAVIKDYFNIHLCMDDFNVTVREKQVDSEGDAIEYFNALNFVKPQQWKHDPNLVANQYIKALEKQFNASRKSQFIRPSAHRPYLSIEKLRDVLAKEASLGNLKTKQDDISSFVKAAVDYNKHALAKLELETLTNTKTKQIAERAVQLGFALAFDQDLKWIKQIANRP